MDALRTIGDLPESLLVNGREYEIRTDYRDIIQILMACDDPELDDKWKLYVFLFILYLDFESMPQEDYEAAYKEGVAFIDHGAERDGNAPSPRIVDWGQDESIMFPAINKVAGQEIRSAEYIHWWTFLGYYMEISEGVFAHVLNLRLKRAKHKKLEKWEREFWNANKSLCVLREKLSAEEQAEKDEINRLLG